MIKVETNLNANQIKIAEALFASTYAVTIGKRAGNPTSVAIPMADFPLTAWQKIVSYGAQRTFNDAIGGSDTDHAAKLKNAREMIEQFKQGIVGRVSAESVDPVTAAIRTIMRGKVKNAYDEVKWAAFTGLEPTEQNAKLDAIFDKQAEVAQKAIREVAEERVRVAMAQKAALGGMAIDVNL